MPLNAGSFRLFRLFGIEVSMHWSWLVVAFYEIAHRRDAYAALIWNVLEYVALFAIVLMHEFGHALATRSVKGQADHIMLWPLGGIAYVAPPPRPAAVLWSIFAGPLVNIILLPILLLAALYVGVSAPDTSLSQYVSAIFFMNLALLIFNMLPIFPLDGGQILHALLWFVLGYARALRVVSAIGFLGAAGLMVLAFMLNLGVLTYVIAIYIAWRAVLGYQMAQEIIRRAREQALQPRPITVADGAEAHPGSTPGATVNSWDQPGR